MYISMNDAYGWVINIYKYIYMCVCVCVCIIAHKYLDRFGQFVVFNEMWIWSKL